MSYVVSKSGLVRSKLVWVGIEKPQKTDKRWVQAWKIVNDSAADYSMSRVFGIYTVSQKKHPRRF